uniref:Cadherin domain-containing protein n=1 Tax=Chelonoidis abingdonii TaxID=106734 RepID=A0A8C0GE41_CHEAB
MARGPPLSCLTILLVKLLACVCQGLQGTIPLGFHFTHSIYNATVYENSAARTYVNSPSRMGITLADLSWDIKYKIVSGDDEGFFKAEEVIIADFCFLRIRTKGGNSAILNREIQDNYLLVVKGSVRGEDLEAWTKVNIQVLDMNDLRPLFSPTTYSVTIAESTPLRTSIAQVTATDADIGGENGYITYSIASLNSLPFSINQFTGVISTSEELDFESSPESYRFIVRASDWGSPYRHESEVNVTIYIGNVNDNKPLFEKVACQGVISSDFPIGGHITAISAIDIDELELVKYKIISGNDLGIFYLNPDSGVLQLKKSLICVRPPPHWAPCALTLMTLNRVQTLPLTGVSLHTVGVQILCLALSPDS